MFFNNSYSILVVPESTESPSKIILPKTLLNCIVWIIIGILLTSTLKLSLWAHERYVAYNTYYKASEEGKYLKKYNSKLEHKVKSLTSELKLTQQQLEKERREHIIFIAQVKNDLNRLEKFYTDLRILAGYKLPAQQAKELGKGGPEPQDEEFLKLMRSTDITFLLRQMKTCEKLLYNEASERERGFWEMKRWLEKQKSMLKGTPDISPIKEGTVYSGYGYRRNPFTGRIAMHEGVDIPAPTGTPIIAPADGVVTWASWMWGYGNLIILDHGQDITTRYAHLSRYNVKIGDRIVKGEIIGYVGSTGRSTGPHLHYEVRIREVPVDPANYLNKSFLKEDKNASSLGDTSEQSGDSLSTEH